MNDFLKEGVLLLQSETPIKGINSLLPFIQKRAYEYINKSVLKHNKRSYKESIRDIITERIIEKLYKMKYNRNYFYFGLIKRFIKDELEIMDIDIIKPKKSKKRQLSCDNYFVNS